MRLRTLALAGLATLVAAAPAQADTFTVNTTADTVGAAGCPTNCTIRNAISAAAGNGTAVDDTIVVPAGTYAVNSQFGALTVPTSATRITIQGAGANTTVIQPPTGVRALVISTAAGVTVTGLTLHGSTIASGQGGSVVVSSQATATFNRVRITGGSAQQGGGIAATGATALTIQSSLIDTNSATGTAGAGGTGVGGGLYVQGQTTATQITIQDTTIVSNTADNGGGIGIQNNVGQPPALRGVTLVRNNARAGQIPGFGGISSAGTNARFQGSIIAGNTRTINLGGGPTTVPANCTLASGATDDGGNVTPDATDQCGLGGVHTDPQLATVLDGSQPPALSIPANSSAVDVAACGTRTVDQRGVSRPQGTACDAGAYEVDKAATMAITSGPTGTVDSGDVTFNFSSNEPDVAPVCQLTGPGQSAGYVACYKSNVQPYSGLGNGAYTFSVRDGAFPTSTPATRSFTVALLDTTISGGPNGPTNDTTPTFTFSGSATAVSFECRVDTGRFTACTSPFTATLAPGTHTFEVQALSASGAPDATPASRSFTIDTTAPDTTISGGPTGTVASTTATFTYTSTETGSTFQCSLDGAAYGACLATYASLPQGAHLLNARATDPAGNVDTTPATRSWTVDTVAPDTTIASITTPTNDTTPTFTLTSTEAGSTFVCRVDTAAFAPCATPFTTSTLIAGSHTFEARAIDSVGNQDATAATFAFVVDTTAPTTTLTPIAALINDNTPTFSFTSSEAGSTFQCRIDTAAFVACPTPFTTAALTDGTHTFDVRATDPAGNQDATPATQTFTVDATAPNTTITVRVSSPDNDNTPTFSFTSSEGGSTFQCRIDAAAFSTCASPFTSAVLTDGSHTFAVRATDPAGNQDATPDTQIFVIDTTTPNTDITGGPSPTTNDATPTFTFTGSGGATSFQCRVDGGAYSTCSSPFTTPQLGNGTHTVDVRALNAATTPDPSPASRTFLVDTTAPDTTLAPIPSPTNDATPTFTFTSNEPNSTFQCRIDSANFASCTSPLTATTLADGGHTFEVRATDVAGNVDATPATVTFTVDTTPPAAPAVVSGPDGPTTNSSPEFTFAAGDATSTACKLDGPNGVAGAFGPCVSPKAFNALAPGAYVFSVRSVDAAGNAQTSERAFTVTVAQQATPSPTPAPTVTPTPTATPTPPPVANQSVDIKPLSGTVLIKLPGSKTFVKLSPSLIKNGAEVDARDGAVEITRSDGGVAKFYDGIFKLSHSGGYTVLTLTEKLTGCPTAKKSSASAAAKKPKTRKLWGEGKGKFRTKGQYSAATVRGTKWLVTDTCTTTVTRVATGVVEVQDLVKKKKLLVKAKKSYTARAKKK